MDPAVPARIGRYDVLMPLAAGGMATVYLARYKAKGGFDREVAVKLTHPHLRLEPQWMTELLEEGRLAARIRHPNVVNVIDVEEDAGAVFLVMDYIEGEALSRLMKAAIKRGAKTPVPIALRILSDALAGLHAAHELRDVEGKLVGVVHRDVSPQNILVGTDGVSRLTDFGVARAADRLGYTKSGSIKGKAAYMSPEQAQAKALDKRSDVWAAAVVAWELFAGREMYPPDDDASVLLRVVRGEQRRLKTVWTEAPDALDEALASALTLRVDQRCATVEELRQRILAAVPAAPADPTQVSEWLWELVPARLEERRAKVAEARRASLRRIAAPDRVVIASDPDMVGASGLATAATVAQAPPRRAALARGLLAIAVLAAAVVAAIQTVALVRGRRAPAVTIAATASAAPSAAPPAASAEPPPPPSASGVAMSDPAPSSKPRPAKSGRHRTVTTPSASASSTKLFPSPYEE
jgi:serine/threonine-protein kinase